MVLQITTAGYDRRSVCFEQYDYCRRLQKGEIEDRRYHFFWVEAPEDADHTDPKVWKAANPSFGDIVQPEFFEDQLTKKPEYIFRRYFLNQWTHSEQAWLPPRAWEECYEKGATIPAGAAVLGMVDVGIKKDSSAFTLLHRRDDGRIVPKTQVFTPKGDGTPLDLSILEQAIRNAADTYELVGVVYDKWSFERSAQMLSDEGLLMIDFPMTNERMVPASGQLYESIVQQQIAHDGDPVLAAHVAAGATKDTERGWRLVKSKVNRPIDALITLVMGIGQIDQLVAGGGFEW
jgi:phage terminase large subunit-like protein